MMFSNRKKYSFILALVLAISTACPLTAEGNSGFRKAKTALILSGQLVISVCGAIGAVYGLPKYNNKPAILQLKDLPKQSDKISAVAFSVLCGAGLISAIGAGFDAIYGLGKLAIGTPKTSPIMQRSKNKRSSLMDDEDEDDEETPAKTRKKSTNKSKSKKVTDDDEENEDDEEQVSKPKKTAKPAPKKATKKNKEEDEDEDDEDEKPVKKAPAKAKRPAKKAPKKVEDDEDEDEE